MNTQPTVERIGNENKELWKKLLAAEAEASRLTYIVESYRVALETACKVAEEAIVDRDMYKQHALDVARELEECRDSTDDEEDYLPAPAEGCQCCYCKGE